jgi:hypothetical protein
MNWFGIHETSEKFWLEGEKAVDGWWSDLVKGLSRGAWPSVELN